MTDQEQAFEDWWNGDEEDEPITDIPKHRAAEIFFDGYEIGSRKPIYMMNATQRKILMQMMSDKIRTEERKRIIDLLQERNKYKGRQNFYAYVIKLIEESAC